MPHRSTANIFSLSNVLDHIKFCTFCCFASILLLLMSLCGLAELQIKCHKHHAIGWSYTSCRPSAFLLHCRYLLFAAFLSLFMRRGTVLPHIFSWCNILDHRKFRMYFCFAAIFLLLTSLCGLAELQIKCPKQHAIDWLAHKSS